ncbi:hypothetical protein FY036_02215 [Mesorhizobium microcysteis]|uniref:Uncharacterized protein n=1 Tax=Neoaquamicrobium microcysteis TaxID=2682781 RepID=A0A5D4H9I7_9HYPH|nr:hypothetical protein [Mesorhizobium microcysteis]TYR35450.1 hypothetical protein FY036_02215 [Mesorhizobium microcysteis]
MTDDLRQTKSAVPTGKNRQPRASKPRPSALGSLSSEELQTLRLDDNARVEFDACVQRFIRSTIELRVFEGEDAVSMDDARYEQLSAAEAELRSSGMAVVHFMAPRILKLRDGAAKRKWRTLLAKFRRDEKLV